MPRILIAECRQEVSTFNPAPSSYDDFVVSFGDEVFGLHRGLRGELGGALSVFEARPDIEVVVQQWPALGRIDAGAEVQALLKAAPEGIYNVTFGGDLAKFIKEGNARGLFKDRTVVSLLTGEPEYADPAGADEVVLNVTGVCHRFGARAALAELRTIFDRLTMEVP